MSHGNGGTHRRAAAFWLTLALVVITDVVTKAMAHILLLPRGVPRDVFGDIARLTLVYNPGAAFGLNLGAYSRWIFMALTAMALVVLARLYRQTQSTDFFRGLALGLVSGGAVANFINRVWSTEGVVDFIDIGLKNSRWPTFNVADIGVSVGAFMLAWVLWREESAESLAVSDTSARQPDRNGN